MTLTSLMAVKMKIGTNKRNAHCFELMGYDFIIDSDFNTWLIEANTNPCLEESSELLKMLLPRMLNDAFKLTVDKIHNPKVRSAPQVLPKRTEVRKVVTAHPDKKTGLPPDPAFVSD